MELMEEMKMFEMEVDRGVYDVPDFSEFTGEIDGLNVSDRTMMLAGIEMSYIGRRVDIKVESRYLDGESRKLVRDKLRAINYKRRGRLTV